MSSIDTIKHALINTLYDLFSLSLQTADQISITLNTDPLRQEFGDITTNAPFIVAKLTKKNPLEVAHTLHTHFKHELIAHTQVAGKGFLNLFLTPVAFATLATELMHKGDQFFKKDPRVPQKRINIEFVSANPTGPLHIGNGRGGIIGDVLGNVLAFLGHHVTKEFYINDAGNQIQKLGESFRARCLQAVGKPVPFPEDGYGGSYLIELADQAVNELGKGLLSKEPSFFATYAKNHLLADIKETLSSHYGITFDIWFSETELHQGGAIQKILERLDQRGFLYEKDGARWFRSTVFGDDKDRVVKKSSGEFTYVAADIAYLEHKILRPSDQLIMILGQDHHSFTIRLKAIIQALGYPESILQTILYQLVHIKEDGEALRMSKRAGKMVTLKDVIATVGRDVARFFYLNRKADAQLDFDVSLALKRTDENPVYYIQYALVRTNSILEKATKLFGSFDTTTLPENILTPHEHLLIKKITALKEILYGIQEHHQPHILTYYLLELTALFHHYYASTRVIDQDHPEVSRVRLFVIILLNRQFKRCLKLLGISCPEAM